MKDAIWADAEKVHPLVYGRYLVATKEFGSGGERYCYAAYYMKADDGTGFFLVDSEEFKKYKFTIEFWTRLPKLPPITF